MHLNDLGNEVVQDVWSATCPTFGVNNQVQVIGAIKRPYKITYYLVRCMTCAEDPEMFGEAIFPSLKGSLVRGNLPCGCSKGFRWSPHQWRLRVSRRAEELSLRFVGFESDKVKAKSKLILECPKHGKWDTTTAAQFLCSKTSCPRCAVDTRYEYNLKPDDVMINSFMASGAFDFRTKFTRSDRKTSQGVRVFWNVECPDCGETNESHSGGLQGGSKPCACTKQRQTQAYINLVVSNTSVIGVKFGIANNYKRRVKQQDVASQYKVVNHIVYNFPTSAACKAAERECKLELECGIIDKDSMSDGYTETTTLYNINKITNIFEKYGGILNYEVKKQSQSH